MAAVNKNVIAIQFASDRLKDENDFVLAAVK